MEAVRVEAVVQPNGRVVLENLPFDDGDMVEVIVLEANDEATRSSVNPIKGVLLKYEDPFEPAVPPEDWNVLK